MNFNNYRGLLIFIPTRNRFNVAINAINSALLSNDDDISIVVSDNSTNDIDLDKLCFFCENRGDSRLSYIRPPNPMPMSYHWEWLIGYLLETKKENHFDA